MTVVLGVSLSSCRGAPSPSERDRGAAAHEPAGAPAVEAVEPGVNAPAPEQPSGPTPTPALFVVEGKGLVRLDHEGAAVVAEQPNGAIVDVFVGPDDTPYVLADRALYAIDGDSLSEVARFDSEAPGESVAPVDSVALRADGELWIAGARGVGRRTGTGWELTPLAELGFEPGEVGVAFDGDGTVWAVGPTRVLYREGDGWRPADIGLLGEGARLLNPQPSRIGRVHVNHGFRVTRIGREDFDSVLIDPKTRLDYTADLDLAPSGHAAVATSTCHLAWVTPKPPTKIWRFSADDYACKRLEAIALDGRLRTWVASREGLSVITEASEVREYPAGTFLALAGEVVDIAVVGDGPELP